MRYGNYDLGRLLETMIALEDPETGSWGIGIDEGGVHAFEALVLARYYMFTQVYFNLTGRFGLATQDPAWAALTRPGAKAGDVLVTNGVAEGEPPDSENFPDARGFCANTP